MGFNSPGWVVSEAVTVKFYCENLKKFQNFFHLFQNKADFQFWHHLPGSLGDIYMHAQLKPLCLCMCRLRSETPRMHPGPGPTVHMEVKNLLRHRPGGQANNTRTCQDFPPQPVLLLVGGGVHFMIKAE